jgi:ankyrin repeat protein
VEFLLNYSDTDADSKGKNGRTPLGRASVGGHKEIVELLLARDDIDPMTKNVHWKMPLTSGTRNGHHSIVKLFLDADFDPDTEDKFYRTPL